MDSACLNLTNKKLLQENRPLKKLPNTQRKFPFKVMETSCKSMEVMGEMVEKGLQNSLDVNVGILCARTAVVGAYFNVRINAKDIKDRKYAENIIEKAKAVYATAIALEQEVIAYIDTKI